MALQQYEGRGGVVIDRNTCRENCINLLHTDSFT